VGDAIDGVLAVDIASRWKLRKIFWGNI
jgi:hypothetical protein